MWGERGTLGRAKGQKDVLYVASCNLARISTLSRLCLAPIPSARIALRQNRRRPRDPPKQDAGKVSLNPRSGSGARPGVRAAELGPGDGGPTSSCGFDTRAGFPRVVNTRASRRGAQGCLMNTELRVAPRDSHRADGHQAADSQMAVRQARHVRLLIILVGVAKSTRQIAQRSRSFRLL